MKQYIFLILISITVVGLTACSNSAIAGFSNQSGGQYLSADYENALPVELQLVLGTRKLEGSDQEVTSHMATELLPLWKAARSLTGSEATATEELAALFKQIQETMTSEQVQAIAAMKLTSDDVGEIAEELGLALPAEGGRFGELTPELQATAQAMRQSGQFPPGDFGGSGGVPGIAPGTGGAFGQGAVLSPEQRATAIAGGGGRARAAGSRISPIYFDALITYLESKVQ